MDYKKALSLLELSTNSSVTDVERAFKKLAKKFHPDKGGSNREMAEFTEARDFLREYFSSSNLPTIINHFEIMMRDINETTLNQRNIERKVEKITEDVHRIATNKLKNWRQMAIWFAAISVASFFLGKEIPKEIISGFQLTEIAILPKKEKPEIPDIVNQFESQFPDSNILRFLSNPDNSYTNKEKLSIISYEKKRNEYEKYNIKQEMISERNNQIRGYNRQMTLMCYTITFMIGIFSAILAWYFKRRIQYIEIELIEFNEELLIKSTYFELLKDIFSDEIPASWTKTIIEKAVDNWLPQKKSWERIYNAIGTKKFVQLLLLKGQEIGFIKVKDIDEHNNYIETYSIA